MGLQALVDGRYIVQHDTFLKAIIDATSSNGSGTKSPLEDDWDKNFPDPLQYLPPRGEEPTEREGIAYAPDPNRSNMFDGYTFVFANMGQYNNLLAPITEGGGKALLKEAIPEKTDIDDFVRFVKGVAGEKDLGSFNDGSEGKRVVVVRYAPTKAKAGEVEWFYEFNRKVSIRLDHRLIEQNEFLDAILGVDASVLRRPLEIESSGIVAPPPTASKHIRGA